MVSNEIGVTIVPESTLSRNNIRGVQMLRIQNTKIVSNSAIIWLKDRYISNSAKHFIRLFQNPDFDQGLHIEKEIKKSGPQTQPTRYNSQSNLAIVSCWHLWTAYFISFYDYWLNMFRMLLGIYEYHQHP